MACRVLHEPAGSVLHLGAGPGGHEYVAHVGQGFVREVGPAQGVVENGARTAGSGSRPGHSHQAGRLALADVAARRLTGLAGVTEDTQQIVADLKSEAGAPAGRRQRTSGVLRGTGQGGSQRQWTGNRVQGALQVRRSQGAGLGPCASDLPVQVEVLPGHHLGSHRPPDR